MKKLSHDNLNNPRGKYYTPDIQDFTNVHQIKYCVFKGWRYYRTRGLGRLYKGKS